MASYTLGDVTLYVRAVTRAFDYDALVTRQRLIGDGSLATNNEVLQSGALPNRSAEFDCVSLDSSDVDTLLGYKASSETLTYTDDFSTRSVVVGDLRVALPWPGLYNLSLTLIEVAAGS
jgi:hypothetical protein